MLTTVEYLLICICEECTEIGKDASKALRFGLRDKNPYKGMTNKERIETEIDDLLGVVELMKEHGIELNIGDRNRIDAKKEKLKRMMFVSRSLGTMETLEQESGNGDG